MKISLIIPAYNEEKYIGRCLEQAINNAGKEYFEIIVIDNASTDRTREIASRFPGVRVVRESEKGLTRARQRGFVEARGDLLAYIDADTLPAAGWQSLILSEFADDPRLVCLSGPYIYYDLPTSQQFLVKLFWLVLALPIYWLVGYLAIGGNFVIRRETLERMSGFDTTIKFYGEDTDLARRASVFGKVKFNLNFAMPTSGRRLSHHGVLRTALLYIINYVSEVVWHRPATKEYSDIR